MYNTDIYSKFVLYYYFYSHFNCFMFYMFLNWSGAIFHAHFFFQKSGFQWHPLFYHSQHHQAQSLLTYSLC